MRPARKLSSTSSGIAWLALISLLCATTLGAQVVRPADRSEVPAYGGREGFEGTYPSRVLSIESGRVLERHHGQAGFGDTRFAPLDRIEVLTNTIGDAVGIANAGVKVLVIQPAGPIPSVSVGGRYYESYGGLIDTGVKHIAGSFSDVTDSETDVRGIVGQVTATWTTRSGRTHYHLAIQGHHAIETEFGVTDSVNGGRGSVRFLDGDDVSTMWGVDHRLIDTRLLALVEAGYSWTLERPRMGIGVDAGSQRLRLLVGVLFPGVKTDLASDPIDLVVTPAFSVHWRF